MMEPLVEPFTRLAKTVTLKQKVPVLLAYWTAWTDPEGHLELRDDVYRRDPVVASGLAERFHVRR